ncbi:MAG: hypothetical protein WC455_11020 [Dehalococcoidia bacterium]|jgi:hypothetical protein
MGDFIPRTIVKSAIRTFTDPIADATAFDTIVTTIVANPFECTPYSVTGENMAAVEVTKRSYGAALVWENAEAKRCGSTTDKYETHAGFDAGVAILMGSAPFAAAHVGTIIHDPETDSYSATIRCHDANGELYNVTLTRETMTVSSYSDDAILTRIETWADGVAALA